MLHVGAFQDKAPMSSLFLGFLPVIQLREMELTDIKQPKLWLLKNCSTVTQQHSQTLARFCVTRVMEHVERATRRHGSHSNPAPSHGIVFVRWRITSVRSSQNNLPRFRPAALFITRRLPLAIHSATRSPPTQPQGDSAKIKKFKPAAKCRNELRCYQHGSHLLRQSTNGSVCVTSRGGGRLWPFNWLPAEGQEGVHSFKNKLRPTKACSVSCVRFR